MAIHHRGASLSLADTRFLLGRPRLHAKRRRFTETPYGGQSGPCAATPWAGDESIAARLVDAA